VRGSERHGVRESKSDRKREREGECERKKVQYLPTNLAPTAQRLKRREN
jgi:hypothetical protein